MDHDGSADDMHTVVRHGVKNHRSRGSLPRGFGSSECIHTSDQSLEMPDRVIKVYKADQTCKYFMVYKVRVEIETRNRIDDSVLSVRYKTHINSVIVITFASYSS